MDTEDDILADLYELVELPLIARGKLEHLDGDQFCNRLCTFSFITSAQAKKAARDHRFAAAWDVIGMSSELIMRSLVPDIVHVDQADSIRQEARFHLETSIKVVEGLERHADRRRGRE